MRISTRATVSAVVCTACVVVLAVHASALRGNRAASAAAALQQDPQMETPLPAADLILLNGRVLTMETATPEAQAIAIRDDAIYVVGTNADVRKRIGPSTQVIDLHGQLAIPGFIESHGHFTGVGETKEQLDPDQSQVVGRHRRDGRRGREEGQARRVDSRTRLAPGEVVVEADPNVEGFPTHASLDKVSPNNPVVLTHASGHAAFVNAQALQVSGIHRTTEESGGRRDPQGPGRRARPACCVRRPKD